jgi:hypothetical protein
MLALLASYLIIAYFLIPSRVFRVAGFFLKLKKFHRTQVEEITFASLFALLPFSVVVFSGLLIEMVVPSFASVSSADYKIVLVAAYSEEWFRNNLDSFWPALPRVVSSQIWFLIPYYALCFLEMGVFVALVKKWGDWHQSHPKYRYWVGKLLGNISQWDMMLTDFNFPEAEQRIAVADALVAEAGLCQGFVKTYFVDENGELSGLFLSSPYRFNRKDYRAARKKDKNANIEDFWVRIPGENLYIPKEKILNLNIWYPPKQIKLPGNARNPAVNSVAANLQLGNEGLPYRATPAEPSAPPKTPAFP